MMKSLHWHSVAAAIILICATPLKAQNPLEQLEAKLLEQEKVAVPKADQGKQPDQTSSENLPGPKSKSTKSLLGNPTAPITLGSKTNVADPSVSAQPKTNSDRAASSSPPYLGMTLERPAGGGLGLRVVEVVNQSPAWKSGFRIDDRILAIAGTSVSDIDIFANEIAKLAPNELIKFLVERRGRQMDINVVLIPRNIAAKTIPNVTVPPETRVSDPSTISPRTNPMTPRVPQSTDGNGALGIVLAPLSDAFRRQFGIPVFRGASVLEVAPNSPGFMAGLAPGDCIVDIDGVSILNDEDVVRWKQTAPAKASYSIGFYRGAQLMQSAIQPQSTGGSLRLNDPSNRVAEMTSDMLTPEYVQRLQSELSQIREELKRAQDRIRSLENASNKSR